MSAEPLLDKREMRRKLRSLLATLPHTKRTEVSVAACAILRAQSVWKNARAVLFYAPLTGEIDLLPMVTEAVSAGKAVALPRFVQDTGAYDAFQIRDVATDCAPGKYGIPEPKAECPSFPLKHLDLALAPGLGFDTAGCRLGRGQGFYDRLLAQIDGIKCGVAFDQQIMDEIPGEKHDVHMNCILTPTRWLEIPG